MSDPVTQAIMAGIEFIKQPAVAAPIAIGVGLYWAVILYQRGVVNDTDPSIRSVNETSLGFKSFIISGAYLSMAIAGVIAFVTWPAPLETPLLGLLLVGGVVFHSALEYREATA